MKYKAVIFDMDGTLLNTLEDIGIAANRSLAANGYPQREEEEYNYFVGAGVFKLFENALPPDAVNEDTLQKCVDRFFIEYDRQWHVNTRLYPGIDLMLDELTIRRIKLAILSNKPDAFVKQCTERYLRKWPFEMAYGNSEEIPRKPDPAGAFRIVDELGLTASDFLYMGDTGIDMKTANRAKMKAVGVLWGFRPKRELVETGAQVLIEYPSELLDLL